MNDQGIRQQFAAAEADGEDAAGSRTAQILERIRAIPPGLVRSYGDIEPGAPRMVGRILATTTEEVPWHRVIRSDGTLAQGERQAALLRAEGVPIRGNRVDFRALRQRGNSGDNR